MSEYLLNCLRLGTAFNKTHKTFDGDRRIAPTFRSLLVGERDTIKQILLIIRPRNYRSSLKN